MISISVIAIASIVLRGVSTQITLYEGDTCNTSTFHGVCKSLQKCAYAYQKVKLGLAPDLVCSFSGFDQIVCCPQDVQLNSTTTTTTGPVTTKPSTNQSLPGQIAAEKCAEYSNSVYTSESSRVLSKKATSGTAINRPAVIGGTTSKSKKFPHMTAVGYNAEKQSILWLCGGTLISKRFVLTAAHCLYSVDRGNAAWARVGDLNLKKDDDDARPRNYRVLQRIKHPGYKSPLLYHDIALLELEEDVEFNAWVRPACLPDSGANEDPEKAIATGWGRTDWTDEEGSEDLMEVVLAIVPNSVCNNHYKDDVYRMNRGIVSESQICAGQEGKDTCQGDSGGPLVVLNGKHFGMYNVIGVTSLGKICGGITPAVYTRVSHYVPWIENTVWKE